MPAIAGLLTPRLLLIPLPQDIPTLVSLPRPLPAGIPEEQQYIQQYCAARSLPYPLQASSLHMPGCCLAALPGLTLFPSATALHRTYRRSPAPPCRPHGPSTSPSPSSAWPPSWLGWAPGRRRATHPPASQPRCRPPLSCRRRSRSSCTLFPLATIPSLWQAAAAAAAWATRGSCAAAPAYRPTPFRCLQVGADSVVRSLACKGLQIAGVLHKQGSSSSSLTSSGGSHLMGTPAEPYANPTHPSALPDDSPNILAGNPLEEYANPSPQWRQAAGAAAAALEEADRVLPARVAPTSSRGSSSSSSSSSSRGVRQQPTAAGSPAATAAAAAGVATTGLGPSPRVQPLLRRLQRFMRDHVYPAEAALNGHAMSDQRWIIHPVQERLKAEAKRQGLWNLWLPAGAQICLYKESHLGAIGHWSWCRALACMHACPLVGSRTCCGTWCSTAGRPDPCRRCCAACPTVPWCRHCGSAGTAGAAGGGLWRRAAPAAGPWADQFGCEGRTHMQRGAGAAPTQRCKGTQTPAVWLSCRLTCTHPAPPRAAPRLLQSMRTVRR